MAFDPLHKWLGIPPNEQPPNHYRLLGLALFEDDADVIDAGADKQLTFLHDLTNGPLAAEAESLSNRVSAARICLCDPNKRAAYDAQLERTTNGVQSTPQVASPDSSQSMKIHQPDLTAVSPSAPSNSPKLAPLNSAASVTGGTPFSPGSSQAATEKAFFAEGWMVKNGDGVTYGPYPYEMILEASRRGTISDATEIQHPVATGNSWVQALSIPEISELAPIEEAAVQFSAPAVQSSAPAVQFSAPAEPVSAPVKPAPLAIRTKKKKKQRAGSWLLAVVPFAMPGVLLIALFYVISGSPTLKQALANALNLNPATTNTTEVESEAGSQTQTEGNSRDRGGDRQETRGEQAKPVQGARTPELVPDPTPPRIQQPVELTQFEFPQQDGDLDVPMPVDNLHSLKLDFGETQREPLKSARVDDQFFVEKVDGSHVTMTLMPASGELKFNQTTHLIFDASNGLGLALKLIRSADSKTVRLESQPTFGSQDAYSRTKFRYPAYRKDWNELGKLIGQLDYKINVSGPAMVDQLREETRRPITLDRLGLVKRQIQAIERERPNQISQRDAARVRWNLGQQLLLRADHLAKDAKLVICVRTTPDPPTGPDSSTSSQP